MAETLVRGGYPFQDAQSSGNGGVLDCLGVCREFTAYISWGTGVTGGAIQFETSDEDPYTGTWAPIGAAVAFSGTAPNKALFQATGLFKFVRARISTAVAGGTVTVKGWAN